MNISIIVYYIKLGTITITQCKAMELSSFDISAVPILSKYGGAEKVIFLPIINNMNIH